MTLTVSISFLIREHRHIIIGESSKNNLRPIVSYLGPSKDWDSLSLPAIDREAKGPPSQLSEAKETENQGILTKNQSLPSALFFAGGTETECKGIHCSLGTQWPGVAQVEVTHSPTS